MTGIPNGRIYITGNIDIILNTPPMNEFGCPVKILDMDDDNVLSKLGNPNIIRAACLLPPVECKIAEADGEERKYDILYHEHFLKPFQQEFMTALIAVMYKNTDIIIYLPEDDYTNTKRKFIQHLNESFGIIIGVLEGNMRREPQYNVLMIPFWIGLMYIYDILSWRDYLMMVPENFILENDMVICNKLVEDMGPYVGKDGLWYHSMFRDQIKYINDFRHKLYKNPNVVPAIVKLGYGY